ncbi:MAG: ABC transporter substrate-binding protein [Candidatus Tectomicrobia bacterium]|nr:ABC transporter substrate-binding protein [Candidatus Tectomicrobia bacterium]
MARNSQRRAWIVFVMVAMALSLLTIMPRQSAAIEGPEIKIGVLKPYTGWGAETAQYAEIAMDMALDKINKAGGINGIPIRLIKYDTRSKAEEAILAARRLLEQDKVLAIMGPELSAEAQVVFPVINRGGVMAVSSMASAPGIAAANRPWAFRNIMTSEKLLEPALAKFLSKHPEIKNVVIVYDNKDFLSKSEGTKLFPELLKPHNIKVVDMVAFHTGDVDYAAQVTKIKNTKHDGIILAALYYEGGYFVRELRRQGVKSPVLAGIGISSPVFMRAGGEATEGVVNAQGFWTGNPRPEVQEFVKEFLERAKGKVQVITPPQYTASNYDSLMITAKIIKESGVTNRSEDLAKDRERIRNGWQNLKDYPGMQGKTSIGADGDAVKDVYIIVVKGGDFVPYE